MHSGYFDLISLPLSYQNFSHFSFLMQVWVFIQQFRHMRGAIYFRTSKFWESISIGALRPTYTNNVPRMRTWLLGHAYFILGKLKSSLAMVLVVGQGVAEINRLWLLITR